jgi:hypothetical protein
MNVLTKYASNQISNRITNYAITYLFTQDTGNRQTDR